MPINQVTIVVPATTANLGPGFDVFGLALKRPYDKVTLTTIPEGIEIEVTGLSANTIPADPKKNTAGVVANHMFKQFQLKQGVAIKIDKGIAPGMGLGSSGASAAATAFGLNHMFNLKLEREQLIRFAAEGEAASAKAEHADNVSAAMCGGFVIVLSYNPLRIVNMKAPVSMEICVAYPHVKTPLHKTQKAREVVPQQVPIDALIFNVGRAAALASGFATGDVDLIGESMSDAIVEPERAGSIPGFSRVKEHALKAGACGVAISGAGPAMIALVNKQKANARKVEKAMRVAFESAGLGATAFTTTPGRGVRILEIK